MKHLLIMVGALVVTGSVSWAQDVTTTNSIRPSNPLGCKLDEAQLSKLQTMSVADMARMTGCEARKISSFDWLGQTTVIYEFRDDSNRLQVTLRNNRLLSQTFRKL